MIFRVVVLVLTGRLELRAGAGWHKRGRERCRRGVGVDENVEDEMNECIECVVAKAMLWRFAVVSFFTPTRSG